VPPTEDDPPLNLCRFVAFKQDLVNRGDIKNAPYNPRYIEEDARKRLRANLDRESGGVGFLGGIIWNRRTGNLVAGHKRLAELDSLMRTKDYMLPVDVVDLDDKTEREQNVFLNNPEAQGQYDVEKLGEMFRGPDKIDHDKAGLDMSMMYQLFGQAGVEDNPEEMLELAERVRQAKELQAKIVEKRAERDADYFYACLIYKTDAADRFIVPVFKDEADLNGFLSRRKLPASHFIAGAGFGNMIFVHGHEFEAMLNAAP
jgi:hypothetical protein